MQAAVSFVSEDLDKMCSFAHRRISVSMSRFYVMADLLEARSTKCWNQINEMKEGAAK